MEKEFVPYEIAVALKELGFNELCFGYCNNQFKKDIIKRGIKGSVNSALESFEVTLPLYQQSFRWFREKYEIFSCVWCFETEEKFFIDFGFGIQKFEVSNKGEAELECLKKLIEIVKSKNNEIH